MTDQFPGATKKVLSPAAQAVLDAFNGYHEITNRRIKIAAALRALGVRINGADAIRQDIFDIATELEAQ